MKLEEGMYVRTEEGKIGKITHIETEIFSTPAYTLDIFPKGIYKGCNYFDGKASHNIIDLIEVGDYVNGEFVYSVARDVEKHFVCVQTGIFFNDEIKSIVTKEQFESISYRVGSEE